MVLGAAAELKVARLDKQIVADRQLASLQAQAQAARAKRAKTGDEAVAPLEMLMLGGVVADEAVSLSAQPMLGTSRTVMGQSHCDCARAR